MPSLTERVRDRQIIRRTEDAIYRRPPHGLLERLFDVTAWRDIDSGCRKFGWTFWSTGCEFHIGKRLYRVRWWQR